MIYELPRGYLSASQLSTYYSCGLKYEKMYVENKRGAKNRKEMHKGSSVHRTFQTMYNDKLGGEEDLTPIQAEELGVFYLEKTYEEEENSPLPENEKDELINDVTSVVKDYTVLVFPHIIPVATEVEFKYKSECGVPILMYIDLLKRRPDGDGNVICDYKITNKKWTQQKLLGELQFLLYTMATGLNQVEIHNLKKLGEQLELGSKKKRGKRATIQEYNDVDPQLDLSEQTRILRAEYPGYERSYMEMLIERGAQGISSGMFLPAKPDSWMCTPKWCEFFEECRGKAN